MVICDQNREGRSGSLDTRDGKEWMQGPLQECREVSGHEQGMNGETIHGIGQNVVGSTQEEKGCTQDHEKKYNNSGVRNKTVRDERNQGNLFMWELREFI